MLCFTATVVMERTSKDDRISRKQFERASEVKAFINLRENVLVSMIIKSGLGGMMWDQ